MNANEIEFENWLDVEKSKEFFNYWNDESYEDIFDVQNHKLDKLEKYIAEIGIARDIDCILSFLQKKGTTIKGDGIDIAAGILWVTAYLLRKNKSINKINCLEFSKHRLLKLGPILLDLYNIDKNRVKLILGDFYDIKMPKESLDFVVLSQALHHASKPDLLLKQIHEILKKDGFVLIVGDLFINKTLYLKCYMNFLVSFFFSSIFKKEISCNYIKKLVNKDFSIPFQELYFPPDPITGDHYHLRSQYHSFFLRNNFFYKEFKSTKKNHLSFLLSKNPIK